MTASPMLGRIGFHYFPDTRHYREADLTAWLPELQAMGATWLTLLAPVERAIPETFLRGLLEAGIEPILHFDLPLGASLRTIDLQLLFRSYARWGVRYVVVFDRPNLRSSWNSGDWTHSDLVERFLDAYLPIAQLQVDCGLTPVFPPLEPGGDFWDTAFLRLALRGLRRRGAYHLIDRLVLSAYAWTTGKALSWGAGGPERWPAARPYFTPDGTEDQRGFWIFDWYSAIARAEISRDLPVILLRMGSLPGEKNLDDSSACRQQISSVIHAQRNLAIARILSNDAREALPDQAAPDEVLAGCFWLLSADPGSKYQPHAWYQPDGYTYPAAGAMREQALALPHAQSIRKGIQSASIAAHHYLLLPVEQAAAGENRLRAVAAFIRQYQPAVGFSIEEAGQSAHVTLAGNAQDLPDTILESLKNRGCIVDRIPASGTNPAS